MHKLRSPFCCLLMFFGFGPWVAFAERPPIQIHADLTDAPRKLFHADIDLPVRAGRVDLVSPEWIPGAHGPDGPILDITGVRFSADGKLLPWRRDPVNTYEYHIDVPAGVSTLHAHVDSIYARGTRTAATLEWESLMLYPAHTPVHEIAIQPTVTVPAHWGIGTSLTPLTPYDPQRPAGGTVQYAPTTVELLQDSPVMAGLYFHEYALAPEVAPKHYMDLIGPSEASIQVKPEMLEQMSHLVREGIAVYGAPHYTSYHFLILLRGERGGGGLEHHESSDNTVPRNFYTGFEASVGMAGILPHEFTHSWNGKYRRPDGLSTPDYATPMQDNLLWVYEGLTNYLGDLMGERTGMVTAEQYRQDLAITAAEMEATSGRAWRSIEDTTFISAMPRNGGGRSGNWGSWRRSTDYYPEGTLLWLDVDTTMRKVSGEKKSLRDFLQVFFAKGGVGVPRVEPYSLPELEADLNHVVPYDWAAFFQQRVYDVQPHVNVEGIEQAGYRVEYTDEPTPYMKLRLGEEPHLGAWFSVGLEIGDDGTIYDVRVGSAADKAGLAPGQKVLALGGRSFSLATLMDAIKAGKGGATPMALMVQDEDTVASVLLPYSDGLRYPRLTRVEGSPDRMKDVLAPITPAKP